MVSLSSFFYLLLLQQMLQVVIACDALQFILHNLLHLFLDASRLTFSASTTISQWKIFCSMRSLKLSDTEPTNIPCVRPEILLGGMSASICVLMEVDTSCRLMEMDCRFCNTLPNRSDSVFAVSPTTCPEKILPTVFITTFASLSP